MEPKFFKTPQDFRKWLEANHDKAIELLVGFWKKGSRYECMTWPESVDQALCFGWIDGVRRRIDDERYSIRFTPRRPRSVWSAVNIAKFNELVKNGSMQDAGRAAYDRRQDKRSVIYSYENEAVRLDPASEKQFRNKKPAWKFFSAQPNWYRRQKAYWIANAKRDETRLRRLEKLIAACVEGKRI